MTIYNAVLTGQRVLFVGYNHAAGDVCKIVLAACALVSPPFEVGIPKQGSGKETLGCCMDNGGHEEGSHTCLHSLPTNPPLETIDPLRLHPPGFVKCFGASFGNVPIFIAPPRLLFSVEDFVGSIKSHAP